MKRLQVRPECRIDKIYEMTEDIFEGEYKGHSISINRESDNDFYIVVTAPCGMYDYDGWWQHDGNDSVRDAVEEALRGSLLLPDNQTNSVQRTSR
jgi:hypothetical protein